MADGHFDRLNCEQAQLLVIDIQERLLPSIAEHAAVLASAERMIRAAVVLELPITVSEQYPRGLGATAPGILTAATGATRLEKMTFSFCADAACRQHVLAVSRPQVLIVGIEAHVCVYQTALDLLEMEMRPFVLADAVGSRRPFDCAIALDGLRAAGVGVTTTESAIFQLVHESGTDRFKRILPIVR
jgi:nicotinamidase-related amidase